MNPFVELLTIIIGVYVNIILLRFFLQYFRADFYNPLSQFVVKATDPLVKPLRKVIPGVGGLDISTLVLAWLVTLAKLIFIALFIGALNHISFAKLLILPIYEILMGALSLFMFLVFVRAILSWFVQGGHNPLFLVVGQLTEPLLAPCRRLIPTTGGFDFSPMLALLGLWFISKLLAYYLAPLLP